MSFTLFGVSEAVRDFRGQFYGQTIESFPIHPGAPPAFVASALDDPVAPTAFAASIVDVMGKAGVPADLWTLRKGGHTAFKQPGGEGSQWADRLTTWLTKLGYWKRSGS